MAAPSIPNWQQQILQGIGAPVTPQNLLFLNTWQPAEGGTAANNPFNTTQPAPGASSYNSVGVRNYGSPQQGIAATIQTLQNGRYQPILDALKQGNDARAAAQALAASPWGTGALVLKMLGGAPQETGTPVAAPPPIGNNVTPATAPRAAGMVPSIPAASSPLSSLPLLQLISANQQAAGLPGLSPLLLQLATSTNAAAPASPAPTTTVAPPQPGTIAPRHPTAVTHGTAGLALPAAFKPTHDTAGLAGFPATDVFGAANSPVFAPTSGRLVYVHMIPWDKTKRVGGVTAYLQGDNGRTYFLTHLGGNVPEGRVQAGQPIGVVGKVPGGWWQPHVHEGIHEGIYNPGGR